MSTITDTVFMVRPANFGFNPETAENNSFQDNSGDLSEQEIKDQAIKEFDIFVNNLREKGVNVIVYDDSQTPIKTDAIFPNNWISLHSNKVLVTYPMYSLNRRKEREEHIINDLKDKFGFDRQYFFDHYEAEDKFLEGTGSMILDRVNKIVYACLSERTNIELLEKFSVLMRYEKVYFYANDSAGEAIYHTNVMMALGEELCVICLDSITDIKERKRVKDKLTETEKEVIEISIDQMNQFAGNMIQLKNTNGEPYIIMSEQAYKSLEYDQVEQIRRHCEILHTPLYTIEKYGGGSARCMIAEVFLHVND